MRTRTMDSMRIAVLTAAVAVCCLRPANGEKVMFRDELTGCEMWRLTSRMTFHEYHHRDKPFSRAGQYMVCREHVGDLRIVVVNLADGSEDCFGGEHRSEGTTENPVFVQRDGRLAVVYGMRNTEGGSVYLRYLDTGEERTVVKMPPGVRTLTCGVIGPNAEYVVLRGDMTGDGLSDWSLKSLWTDDPIRVVWTAPNTSAAPKTASPVRAGNRIDLNTHLCHPDILRRARSGEKVKLLTDSKPAAYIAVLDIKTCEVKTYPAKHARFFTHEAWSGDGEYLHKSGYSWRAGADASTVPIRIGDSQWSNHYGTCGNSGRYVAGDSGRDGMERLELTDLWTGEMRTVAHISTPTEPAGKMSQDHGHPAGSPDGTKVLIHSCYDLVNHRLYAIPTKDIRAGDTVIPVETTEGFADKGKLLIGHGYSGKRMMISYEHADATNFSGCDWGDDAQARLKGAIRSDVIRKGTRHITDYYGRLFPDDGRRPRKEYIAVIKQPDPPRALAAKRTDKGVSLSWELPTSHKETAGYVVYQHTGAGAVERLTTEPVASCEYVDNGPPDKGKVGYLVRAVEHSGLYGAYSSPAWVDGERAGVDLVDSYDVRGCTYVAPGERPASDRRSVRVRVPVAGDYVFWGRCRTWRGAETLHVSVDGNPLSDASIDGANWHWARLASCRLNAGEHTIELAREETYDIKEGNLARNPGFENGLEGWTFDENVTSVDATRSHLGKQCVKLSGTLTKKKLFQTIDLEVKPEWSYRLSFQIRGKLTKGKAPPSQGPLARIAVNIESFPYPLRWVWNGNQFDDEQWREIEIVVNSPPCSPGKKPVRRVRAQPFWCPWYWGEQVGTVWIDDVHVAELGPRLRPVKVTKLLVTNVGGYTPKGLNGREAYPFPQAPLIAVTGLRQTGRMRNAVTLEWDAGRAGTRGYNVYANAGPDCPITKYFRSTSVWGKTSVTLDGLSRATSFTVKVTAINEDGIEGPAVSVQAGTSTAAAETHVLEAERAALTPPMRVERQGGVTFLVSPADRTRMDELYDLDGSGKPTGRAKFELSISEGGQYAIWGRLFAPNGGSNSLWFSLDGQPETSWGVSTAAFNKWSWLAPVDGKLWELKPGRHTITVRTREAGSRLDRIVVTNDLDEDKLRAQ